MSDANYTRRDYEAALAEALDKSPDPIRFWWRDDDAIEQTDALETMLSLQGEYNCPLGITVIPATLQPSLPRRLKDCSDLIVVLQHGWQHTNHAPKDEKKQELGLHRSEAVVLKDLTEGRKILKSSFQARFLPALTPPWNRIAPEIAAALPSISLPGLTTFNDAPEGSTHQCNTHVDIIDWKTTRGFIGWQALAEKTITVIERRIAENSSEPIGFLSHHLVHDQGCWDALEATLSVTRVHRNACWPELSYLFDL